MDKQESRIWHKRYILYIAAGLIHSIKSNKVFVEEIHWRIRKWSISLKAVFARWFQGKWEINEIGWADRNTSMEIMSLATSATKQAAAFVELT